jgi:hypothetical protein
MASSTKAVTRTDSITLTVLFDGPARESGPPPPQYERALRRAQALQRSRQRHTVESIRNELRLLGRLAVIAEYTSMWPSPKLLGERQLANRLGYEAPKIPVARLSYASPLEVGLVVSQAVLASVSALSALIYGVKRLYGLDLELRTHREERRVQFLAAQQLAKRIGAGSDDGASAWPPEVKRTIDNECDADPGRTHRAARAILSDEDVDPGD